MEQLVRVRQEFEASHKVPAVIRERCQRLHGHRWLIEVEKQGDEAGLELGLYELAAELHDRDLNEMFPGSSTAPEQLAVLFMERLLLAHPTITQVAVGDGRVTGVARNTRR